MSPEHVEGKPLDFRTDVFSVGILLYQLATGELPFKGKNPHEILKRIAECRYLDARVANPLVGDRLGKIIAKALSRAPEDRFQDVSQLLEDLQRYLGEAELDEPRKELARFFAQPASYEQALRTRLLAVLGKLGKEALSARRVPAALELFNRVLTIDPTNEEVLREIDRLSRRRRLTRAVGLGSALLLLGGGAIAILQPWEHAPAPGEVGRDPPEQSAVPASAPTDAASGGAGSVPKGTSPSGAAAPAFDASLEAGAPVAPGDVVRPRPPRVSRPDASALVESRTFRIEPPKMIRNSWTYRIDDGKPQDLAAGGITIDLIGVHEVTFSHQYCEPHPILIGPGTPDLVMPRCQCRPVSVVPRCGAATSIQVGDKAAYSGTPVPVNEHLNEKCTAMVQVDFLIADGLQTHQVEVKAGADREVRCEAE
jgi:serine/threonine-protein kinase